MPQTKAFSDVVQAELDGLGLRARAVVFDVPAHWDVGPVIAYLFAGPPVTLIDAGLGTDDAYGVVCDALGAERLAPSDVERIIVTHAHSDHFGGAIRVQQESGCEVLLHPADLEVTSDEGWRNTVVELFKPLGFSDDELAAWLEDGDDWRTPDFTPLSDRRTFDIADTTLRIEHHPGHMPGHIWAVEERTGAIFTGDYLIQSSPTNAGLEIDRGHPSGRQPLLAQYNAGLGELARRETPVLFASHGPPIRDHAAVIERRLTKSGHRTDRVLKGLGAHGPATALALGRRLYGDRASTWPVIADLAGRLDLLTADGRAHARMGEDGAWLFEAAHP